MTGGAEAVEWRPSSQEERGSLRAVEKSCGDGWLDTGGKGPERWGKVEGDYQWSVFVCYCTDILISHIHRVQTGDMYLDRLSE